MNNSELPPLSSALRDFLIEQDWSDEIEFSEDRTTARVATSILIDGQPIRTFFEIDEEAETFGLYMYTPFSAPPSRMPDVARLLNRMNMRMRLGRLCCADDAESNPIQFKAAVDVEGSVLSARQIEIMLGAGTSTMERYLALLAKVSLTEEEVEAAWSAFLEREEAAERSKSSLN